MSGMEEYAKAKVAQLDHMLEVMERNDMLTPSLEKLLRDERATWEKEIPSPTL